MISIISLPSVSQTRVDNNVAVHSTANYRLFPTENTRTFLKLNTQNGVIWQVTFDIEKDNRFESYVNTLSLVGNDKLVNERFTLYSTENIYTFILLDQFDGRMWQVHWSEDPVDRVILPIQFSYNVKD